MTKPVRPTAAHRMPVLVRHALRRALAGRGAALLRPVTHKDGEARSTAPAGHGTPEWGYSPATEAMPGRPPPTTRHPARHALRARRRQQARAMARLTAPTRARAGRSCGRVWVPPFFPDPRRSDRAVVC